MFTSSRWSFEVIGIAIATATFAGCASPVAGADDADEPTIPASQEDPADFVLTPSGYYHKDCVIDVGDDATLSDDGTATHPDGTTVQIPECLHAHYTSLDELTGATQALAVEPTINGWVTDTNKWANTWYKKITATWSVPTNPAHWGNQTIFFFPGFEPSDGSTIVQPVLQYGSSAAGGGEYWAIASWDCNKSCPHSTVKRVAVGDVIAGTAAGSSCTSGGACTWTITAKDNKSGVTSTLTRKESKSMPWAVVTLEEYGITQCNENPSSGIEGFDVTVENNNNTTSTAAWTTWSPSHVPHCDYHASSPDHAHAYLSWN